MTRQELFEIHDDICKQALEIMKQKNHDYSGPNDIFANFTRSESMGICSTEQGFLVRICDKFSRLSTFVSTGTLKVENESYHDAILDIINYLILFHSYQITKQNPDPPKTDPPTT